MQAWCPAPAVALAALFSLSFAHGQGGEGLFSPASPEPLASEPVSLLLPAPREPEVRPLEPSAAAAPGWQLALWGVSPYAEIQEAGLPLPPSPAEVAALDAPTRMQQQTALKRVWLERLIGAREQRNRVTRELLSRAALQAQQLGAPAVMGEMLRRQAIGGLPARERHLLDTAQQTLLASYGVDAREIRFFVESCGLSAEQLQDVAAWLPLPTLFDAPAPAAGDAVSPNDIGKNYVEFLAARRDLAAIWQRVVDRPTADAAADALLPVLARHLSSMRPLAAVPERQRAAILAPYARFAFPVNNACLRERERLQEKAWFGSHRLLALDYLFH